MTHAVPSDLVPLPTTPWEERPSEVPIDIEEARTALWTCRGNVTSAAKLLKVPAQRLRALVKSSRRLSREIEEAREVLMDISESNIYEALTDDTDPGRRDSMSRYVMSTIGKARGFGTGNNGVTINSPKGPMVITWGDGSSITGESRPGDDAKLVNGDG